MIQVFFLLEKVLFYRSTFQALAKEGTKGIWIDFFVKDYKVDKDEKKGSGAFAVADHDDSVAEPFSTTNCQDSYPRYQNG